MLKLYLSALMLLYNYYYDRKLLGIFLLLYFLFKNIDYIKLVINMLNSINMYNKIHNKN